MGIGVPMGAWEPHTFTSAADVLAAGLTDGDLWILFDAVNPIEAGIWPQVPGGGGTCPPAADPVFPGIFEGGAQTSTDNLGGGSPEVADGGDFPIANPT